MERNWNGLPYLPISKHYQNVFSEKVYKIPLAIADDCPNRAGLKGMQACVFCDEWGSAARTESLQMDLRAQLEKYQRHYADRYKAKKFLAYFQAYTSTFLKLKNLQQQIAIALSYPGIEGVVIGTRPDCVSKAVLDYWQELAKNYYVAIEFGVQSFKDTHLEFLRRGHSAEASCVAIEKTAQAFLQHEAIASEGNWHIGIHLIFGCPEETDEEIIAAAEKCNQLPIQSVKLHHLHVLKNTPLAELYAQGKFTPIDFATYSRRVRIFLEYLSPLIHIDRLAAYAPRWEELIAPEWTKNKMQTHQHIIDGIRAAESYQSRHFTSCQKHEFAAQKSLRNLAQKSAHF